MDECNGQIGDLKLLYFQMDECNGQIGDLKRQQQQLLDRDGTSKLVDRIEGVELLLNTELMKVKGNLCRGVNYSKKNVYEII